MKADVNNKITVFDVAKFVFEHIQSQSPTPITQMQLHKLLWFCQGWHYGVFRKPLFEEDFEAWQYGPVSRDIWDRVKGKIDLTRSDFDSMPNSKLGLQEGESKELVEEVLDIYGEFTAAQLALLSHECKPWNDHKNEPQKKQVIPHAEIKDYFCEQYRKYENAE